MPTAWAKIVGQSSHHASLSTWNMGLVRRVTLASIVCLVALLPWTADAQPLCMEPVQSLLDETLQRSILFEADRLNLLEATRSIPSNTFVPSGGDSTVEPGNGPTLGGITTEPATGSDQQRYSGPPYDCRTIILHMARDHPDMPAPTVAPPEVEAAPGHRHRRWYLLQASSDPSTSTADYSELRIRMAAERASVGDVAIGFPDLGIIMIHVTSMEQFAQLTADVPDPQFVHLLENYPLLPSMASAKMSIGQWYPFDFQTTYAGEGFAIAVVDSGIDPMYFRETVSSDAGEVVVDRLIYEACFSSRALPLIVDAATGSTGAWTTSLCDSSSAVRANYEPIFGPSGDLAKDVADLDWAQGYAPMETLGYGGGACIGLIDCDHGTLVGYMAAGRHELEYDKPLDEVHAPGVAPAASIISIKAVSNLPSNYCRKELQFGSGCIGIMPLDILRALSHLHEVSSWLPSSTPGATLVAINISYAVERPCAHTQDADEACEEQANVSHWNAPYYTRACNNPIAMSVRRLLERQVWTTVGAGNSTTPSDAPAGTVSLPGCVSESVTVGAIAQDGTLASFSNLSPLVDFVAPGWKTRNPIKAEGGTSYAAPMVAGAIALTRERLLRDCGMGFPHDLALLLAQRQPLLFETGEESDQESTGRPTDYGLDSDRPSLRLLIGSETLECPEDK